MLYATHAEIDLDAIAHNVRQVRAIAPAAKVLVAVKANAYGHGAVAVARHLEGMTTAAQLAGGGAGTASTTGQD